ncbi:MAG: MFS transporter [Rhodospirillaceae bacterium]|nr:MFS transporter [Rhodospirillales bacterium]
MSQTFSPRALALRVLAPFAAGYFLSFLYRTVNAVLAPHISREVHLDAGDLGLMTGMYFLTFGAFQLPLGILLDRFGPRRVEAALLLFAAAGAFAFSLADGAGTLIFGRALVGLGVSACLMAALKANVQFFPALKLPLMNGVVLSAGGLGAVAATAPVQAALAFTDWRGIYVGIAALTVMVAAILFLAVPDRHSTAAQSGGLRDQLRDVAGIFRDRGFRHVMPIGMLAMGSFLAIQGLWAGPWLRDVAGLNPDGVALGLTTMAASMTAGFLLMGVIADRMARLHVPVVVVGGVGMVVFWLAQSAMALGWVGAPLVLCALFGFFGSSSSLMYAVVTQLFPAHLAGRATTSINLTMFLAAFLLQWGLGAIIGWWPKGEAGWPPEAYTLAFGIPSVLMAAALLWFIPAARTAGKAEPHRISNPPQ